MLFSKLTSVPCGAAGSAAGSGGKPEAPSWESLQSAEFSMDTSSCSGSQFDVCDSDAEAESSLFLRERVLAVLHTRFGAASIRLVQSFLVPALAELGGFAKLDPQFA